MMLTRTWKKMQTKEVINLRSELQKLVTTSDRVVHIGTDSQNSGQFTEYITVVVVLNPGKGGCAFYTRERVPRIKSLRERLMKEVWMSVELGLELNGDIPSTTDLTIHIDANPDVRFKSSTCVQEMVGLVVGQGFKHLLKPDSWAATHAADHIIKSIILK
jgi:predicted RNase H-related nuclease YkuK (DUF458 family)